MIELRQSVLPCKIHAPAKELIVDYLRDCALVADDGNTARCEALAAICRLRDVLCNGKVPEEQAWVIALRAAERWQQLG